eukprot:SAG31_NODE_3135_length_4636_cov_7.918448_4_plen_77_part_00
MAQPRSVARAGERAEVRSSVPFRPAVHEVRRQQQAAAVIIQPPAREPPASVTTRVTTSVFTPTSLERFGEAALRTD